MNAFGRGRRLALTGLGAVAIALAGSLARADAQAPPGPSGADLGAETRMLAPFALELTQESSRRVSSPLVGEDQGGGRAVLRNKPAATHAIISSTSATPHP